MDRRTFLRASSASVVPLLAGCIASPDDSGSTGNGTDGAGGATGTDSSGGTAGSDAPGSAGGDRGSLLPAAKWATLPANVAAPASGFVVGGIRPSRYLAAEGNDRINATRKAEDLVRFWWGRVSPEDVDLAVQVFPPSEDFEGYYRVVLGSFDAAAVRERLSEDAHSQERYRGYDIYGEVYDDAYVERARDEEAFAVGDGVLIQSGHDIYGTDIPGSVPTLRRVVDVGTGNAESYVAQSDALRSIATRLEPAAQTNLAGAGTVSETNVEEGVFAGMTAKGSSVAFDGPTAQRTEVFAFESADAASSAPFGEFVSQEESRSEIETASYAVDGDLVTVERTAAAVQYL